jgi:hypothetical protein
MSDRHKSKEVLRRDELLTTGTMWAEEDEEDSEA